METGNDNLYYVGVRFSDSQTEYSYICTDLSVKVGDQVIVPVYNGEELQATVIAAQFYSPDEVPYPVGKTKKVIRKVEPEQEKTAEEKPVSVVEKEKAVQPDKKQKTVTSITKNKKHTTSSSDIIAIVLTLILAVPLCTVILSFPMCVPLVLLGWNGSDGSGWLPIVFALPISIYVCIHMLNKAEPGGSTRRGIRGTYYNDSGSSEDAGGGWYPGCHEDKALSSTDRLFDFNGDGHLNAFERSERYDFFFGDDE